MKKIIALSIFFSGSLVCRTVEPTPAPVADMQTMRSVQAFQGAFLQYLIFLLQQALVTLHLEDREVIKGAFIVEAYKRNCPQTYGDYNSLVVDVIKAKVFSETWNEANKFLQEPGPSRIANSHTRNVEINLKKEGICGHAIRPYMGDELRTKTIRAVSNVEYDQYRRQS
jgi:hypothetical protein